MDPSMKPSLLVIMPIGDEFVRTLSTEYEVHDARGAAREAAIAAAGPRIEAVLTNGTIGLDAATMARLPCLRFIGCLGAGYENVDLATARARGIVVTNGPGANDKCVADHAFALILAVVRGVVAGDRIVRAGQWAAKRGAPPMLTGKRLGILGLGAIGLQIAKRAEAFEMPIAYHNRRPRSDVTYRYVRSARELAENCDILAVSCPGGPATRHLVNGDVLQGLGPRGILVNIARGSVVDTAALIAALRGGTIAGAGLDVVEGEPDVPAALLEFDNVVLTPHLGGRSPETARSTFELFHRNLRAFLAGEPVPTPVPG
jgi:lactate dehydrogenase-like 2-hydroxyacid dehydrogenase